MFQLAKDELYSPLFLQNPPKDSEMLGFADSETSVLEKVYRHFLSPILNRFCRFSFLFTPTLLTSEPIFRKPDEVVSSLALYGSAATA